MIEMKQFNCAVIGCGRIGCGFDDKQNEKIMTHAGSYFKNKKTTLTALCDIDTKKLKKYGRKYKVNNLYTDSKEMFESQKLDCISICTLADSHLDLVKEAVSSNIKAIFIEKPLSDNLKTSNQIIKLCKKNNVKLAIDFQRHFNPFYHHVKKILSTNKLGKIQLLNVFYGGGIANTGTHLFDLLIFLFGDVKSISANFSKNKSANSNDPNIDAILNFRDNIICQIHSLDYNNYVIFEMNIFGTMARLQINLVNDEYNFQSVQKVGNIAGYNTLKNELLDYSKSSNSSIFLAIDNIVNCIGNKKQPLCTGIDGYRSLELVIGCKLAAETQKTVLLPLTNLKYKISSK